MRFKYINFFLLWMISFSLSANEINGLSINSEEINLIEEENIISFKKNILIETQTIKMLSQEAVYFTDTDIIELNGKPSLISKNKNNYFKGEAEKIIFFNDEKIHLIGKASMVYRNININSKRIIFNSKSGLISKD